MIMFFPKSKEIKGFTLIEALVAIVILTIGVLGPLSVATRGITDGLYAQNQLTALYLAQEGIEAIRVVVENNIKERNFTGSGISWLRDLDSCYGSGCRVSIAEGQVNNITFDSCSVVDCTQMMVYTGTTGFYKLATPSASGFARKIIIEPDPSSTSRVTVHSQISWFNKNISKSFELETHLYDQS